MPGVTNGGMELSVCSKLGVRGASLLRQIPDRCELCSLASAKSRTAAMSPDCAYTGTWYRGWSRAGNGLLLSFLFTCLSLAGMGLFGPLTAPQEASDKA